MWTITFRNGMTRTFGDVLTPRSDAYAYGRNIADMYGTHVTSVTPYHQN